MQRTISPLSRWMYPLALAAAILAVTITIYTGAASLKDLVTPLLSLFSTFFGATFAFRLNEEKELRKTHALRREAINRALFVLVRQTNAIHQITQNFEKFPSLFEKAFNLPALKPPPYQDLSQSLSDLEFLVETSTPSLLMQVAIEQERFHQALESIRIRNEFYVVEVQPALAALALNGKRVTVEEMAASLGERLFSGAMSGAQSAWEHASLCTQSIPTVHKALFQEAKLLYPEHKFISYEIPT